jgi:predicted  nucleic acid-binding Zn-ribbon protein
MADDRLARIEQKLDKMSEAIVSLARMEERMITLFKRMDAYDERQTTLEGRIQQVEVKQASALWTERVVWAVVLAVISWAFK